MKNRATPLITGINDVRSIVCHSWPTWRPLAPNRSPLTTWYWRVKNWIFIFGTVQQFWWGFFLITTVSNWVTLRIWLKIFKKRHTKNADLILELRCDRWYRRVIGTCVYNQKFMGYTLCYGCLMGLQDPAGNPFPGSTTPIFAFEVVVGSTVDVPCFFNSLMYGFFPRMQVKKNNYDRCYLLTIFLLFLSYDRYV